MGDKDPRDPEERLLRRLTRRERVTPSLAGSVGAAGTPKDRPLGTFPTGDEGDVWTMRDNDGDLFPGWAASAASAPIGRYRYPIHSTYGGGSLIFDSDGHLMYVLLELEP